jgi:hypothetical protein
MIRKIETQGTDVVIAGRRNGGYTIEQGTSHILLMPNEAAELAAALTELTWPREVATPSHPRLMRYPIRKIDN